MGIFISIFGLDISYFYYCVNLGLIFVKDGWFGLDISYFYYCVNLGVIYIRDGGFGLDNIVVFGGAFAVKGLFIIRDGRFGLDISYFFSFIFLFNRFVNDDLVKPSNEL